MSPINCIDNFIKNLMSFKEKLFNLVSGFLVLHIDKQDTICRKTFCIPHVYEKCNTLINCVSSIINILSPYTLNGSLYK